MDDPHLQRAIYASIQTARSQGYNLSKVGAQVQSYRPSFQPSQIRDGGGGGGGGLGSPGATGANRSSPSRSLHPGGNIHHSSNQPHRHQQAAPRPRSYQGNGLPGVGGGPSSSGGSPSYLRASFGRIDTLRRDGIVAVSPGPVPPHGHAYAHALSHAHARSHAHQHPQHQQSGGPGSPALRALPASVPPRATPSPHRLRNQTQQQQHQHQQQQPRKRPEQINALQAGAHHRNTVLEAIAEVTAEAHAAFNAAAALPPPTAGYCITASPLTMVPPSPTGGGGKASSPAQLNPASAAAAAPPPPPVAGGGPPPRALVPMSMAGGGVAMVPEGLDPVLAQAVLRDAVTWDTCVTFGDIAGCDRAKQLLQEAVALPLIIPEFFTGIREPWRGVLLHGPPGNGKTMLAKAVAGMVGGAFFSVSPASLTSKWRGESEKLLAALFAVAQAHAPAVVFIDEVDALGGARGADGEHEAGRRFKAELLQQMDGLSSGRGVMVLAAANCPWDLDPALRRRLEKRIHIGLPDAAQRLALLRLHLRGVALAADVDLGKLAAAIEGFSGADIRLLCRDAAMAPLRRQLGGLTLGGDGGGTSAAEQPLGEEHEPLSQRQQPQQHLCPTSLVLRSAADIRRLADSGELARGAVVAAADLEAARGAVRPSVSAEQAARYVHWDAEFAST